MVTTFEVVLTVSCIISGFVGYSLGEYFTKQETKKIVKQTLKEKDDHTWD
ncbi:hypothetical protein [Virgibacillus salexigens]|nr:hypothetical protein [Virgibacillus salexigens]